MTGAPKGMQMGIRQLRLQNFKCFADSGCIPIAPLTLILGKNNSGKSSILQSLLLLRQSVDTSNLEARLSLRGSYYEAGTYADLVHQHLLRKNITLEVGLRLPGAPTLSNVSWQFQSDEPRLPRLVR